MDGIRYEKRVVNYLRNHGFHNVSITKTSGDYGVDITASKRFHRYAIQCKYYSRPVGIAAVQQVVAGMNYYSCDRAMVITNNTFTRQAISLAEHNSVTLLPGIKGSFCIFSVFLLRLLALIAIFLIYLLGYRFVAAGIIMVAVCYHVLRLTLNAIIRQDISDSSEAYDECTDSDYMQN